MECGSRRSRLRCRPSEHGHHSQATNRNSLHVCGFEEGQVSSPAPRQTLKQQVERLRSTDWDLRVQTPFLRALKLRQHGRTKHRGMRSMPLHSTRSATPPPPTCPADVTDARLETAPAENSWALPEKRSRIRRTLWPQVGSWVPDISSLVCFAWCAVDDPRNAVNSLGI